MSRKTVEVSIKAVDYKQIIAFCAQFFHLAFGLNTELQSSNVLLSLETSRTLDDPLRKNYGNGKCLPADPTGRQYRALHSPGCHNNPDLEVNSPNSVWSNKFVIASPAKAAMVPLMWLA